jgi:hypothetical protein
VRFRDGDGDYQEQPDDEWWERFDVRMDTLWDRLDLIWGDDA